MPAHHNGIIHAAPGDRVSTWPATSQQLAQWLDGNMVRSSDVADWMSRLDALEEYSGVRDITAEVQGLHPDSTGVLRIWRRGPLVEINAFSLRFESGGNFTIWDMSYGLRPVVEVVASSAVWWGHNQEGASIRAFGSGLAARNVQPYPASLAFSMVYITPDPMPSVWPGEIT